ncbi:hypothetical protein Tco_1279335 [Tanacetum coccineum]
MSHSDEQFHKESVPSFEKRRSVVETEVTLFHEKYQLSSKPSTPSVLFKYVPIICSDECEQLLLRARLSLHNNFSIAMRSFHPLFEEIRSNVEYGELKIGVFDFRDAMAFLLYLSDKMDTNGLWHISAWVIL